MPINQKEQESKSATVQEQLRTPLVEAPQEAERAEITPAEAAERAAAESEAGVKAAPSAASPAAPAPATPAEKSVQLQRIEAVLQSDLEDLYFQMDEAHRTLFKEEGEKTARAIDQLMAAARATAQKILYLIQRWLRLIPGINKFFLEQEAKIKTDKMMALADEKKK
ncbi:hypothetical protein A3J43_03480 [Candidatus Uhrbacteria bacterium RIFCSPHIGHO2_12_FULL_54_23]|uniref:Uncharacterized protein n=3 Tax=Candidatus Uhriibacteriota TaxID=1752732 RepID=A0A1F7UNA2_9BACT|nr:MAG: hypothetical protein A3J43_03480 [Candidatus Uhrbacteria bacterium RIFCSPHIGHO2_12_FULL_54_23]OGL85142.1 MAG: hypothetical protein A3B36_02220 [Candidatus Uhrbacteria bacterium RIFCSPLOWO2_01_FULL_55_36]OGL91226.1 MAG: hypothetical protein A3J36_02190 [Candidatus Uhrbacteria bacterium RIFCSPLOWO2_02_FULL_54_37]